MHSNSDFCVSGAHQNVTSRRMVSLGHKNLRAANEHEPGCIFMFFPCFFYHSFTRDWNASSKHVVDVIREHEVNGALTLSFYLACSPDICAGSLYGCRWMEHHFNASYRRLPLLIRFPLSLSRSFPVNTKPTRTFCRARATQITLHFFGLSTPPTSFLTTKACRANWSLEGKKKRRIRNNKLKLDWASRHVLRTCWFFHLYIIIRLCVAHREKFRPLSGISY